MCRLGTLCPSLFAQVRAFGMVLLHHYPASPQLVNFTGCAAPLLRLGTMLEEHGTIPVGTGHSVRMEHGVVVRPGHQP